MAWKIAMFYDELTILMMFIGLLVAVIMILQYLIHTSFVKYSHKLTLEVVWTLVPLLVVSNLIVSSVNLIFSEELILQYPWNWGFSLKVTSGQWYWKYTYMFNLIYLGVSSLKCYMSFDVYMVGVADLMSGVYRNLAVKFPVVLCHFSSVIYFTTYDVIHSFSLPGLSIKVDCIPGRVNVTKLGMLPFDSTWYGSCTEICGVNHSFMPIHACTPPNTW